MGEALRKGGHVVFIGEYHHSLDPKGRIILPAKFREELGEVYIITKGLDNCLAVYSMGEWLKIEEKLKSLPSAKSRNLKRFLFSSAAEVSPDKSGRTLIPPALREYAGLEKEIAVIGALSCIEIWNKGKWDKTCSDITPESVAEAMDELGF